MREDARIERRNEVSGIHEKGGKWFMRFDRETDGAEVPASVARIMRAAFVLEKKRNRESNIRDRAVHGLFNCHRTALCAIGLIETSDPPGSQYNVPLFPADSFKSFDSVGDLSAYIRRTIGNSLGIVQIKKPTGPGAPEAELEHTFLAGVDSEGRVVCFEKEAYMESFRITALENIYEYRDFRKKGSWVAGPVDSITGQTDAARRVHAYTEKEKEIRRQGMGSSF